MTDHDVAGVVLAVQDEVYAHGYARYYAELGAAPLTLYVRPCRDEGMIRVIYKLLPFGEVLRGGSEVTGRHRGLMLLLRDPTTGFPPTGGGAMLTVYLPDDDVIRMKTTWRRVPFTVQWDPSQDRVRAAKEREEQRGR